MKKRDSYGKPIIFCDMAIHGNSAWFCNWTYCALFCLDLEDFRLKLETFLPSDASDEFRQYGALAYYDNKIILAPASAKNIVIYDIAEKKPDVLRVDLGDYAKSQSFPLFTSIHIYQDAAFLFPGTYPGIVKIDLKTYKIKYIRDWHREIALSCAGKKDIIFFRSHLRDDGVCILPCWQGDKALEINLDTEEYGILSLKYKNTGLSDVVYSGDTYWFSCREETSVIKYSKENGSQALRIDPAGMEAESGFRYLLDAGDSVYGIPFYGNMMVQIDKKTGRAECLRRFCTMEFTSEMGGQGMPKNNITCCREDQKGRLILFSLLDGKIVLIDKEANNFTEHSLLLNEEDKEAVMMHLAFSLGREIHLEQEGESLSEFISLLGYYRFHENIGEKDF